MKTKRCIAVASFMIHGSRSHKREEPPMPATTEALSDYEKERGKPLPSFNHGTIQALVIGELLKHRDEFSIVSELSLELPRGEAGENGEPLRVTPDI
ncbi:MAG: hypothetical protein BRD47_04455, partial [Bacteroidetes bacterium QS_8_68_28]